MTAEQLFIFLKKLKNKDYDLTNMEIRFQVGEFKHEESISCNNININSSKISKKSKIESLVFCNTTDTDLEYIKQKYPDSLTEIKSRNKLAKGYDEAMENIEK